MPSSPPEALISRGKYSQAVQFPQDLRFPTQPATLAFSGMKNICVEEPGYFVTPQFAFSAFERGQMTGKPTPNCLFLRRKKK